MDNEQLTMDKCEPDQLILLESPNIKLALKYMDTCFLAARLCRDWGNLDNHADTVLGWIKKAKEIIEDTQRDQARMNSPNSYREDTQSVSTRQNPLDPHRDDTQRDQARMNSPNSYRDKKDQDILCLLYGKKLLDLFIEFESKHQFKNEKMQLFHMAFSIYEPWIENVHCLKPSIFYSYTQACLLVSQRMTMEKAIECLSSLAEWIDSYKVMDQEWKTRYQYHKYIAFLLLANLKTEMSKQYASQAFEIISDMTNHIVIQKIEKEYVFNPILFCEDTAESFGSVSNIDSNRQSFFISTNDFLDLVRMYGPIVT